MESANPTNQGLPPPSSSALDQLIERIIQSTGGGEGAGSYQWRLRVWPARTRRNPTAGGTKKDIPSAVDRPDGWPVSSLMADGDEFRVMRALLARGLLQAGCDPGENFSRDVELILLAPPIGDEAGFKEGKPERLGGVKISRAELEAAQAAATPREIAQAVGQDAPPSGLDSPPVQQTLHTALDGVLQTQIAGQRLIFDKDRDATTQLSVMLGKVTEMITGLTAAATDQRRADAEVRRIEDAARIERAEGDLKTAKLQTELAESIRLLSERVRNPDPMKTWAGRLMAAVEKPIVGLINAAAVGVASGAPAAPALPAPAPAPALPAAPVQAAATPSQPAPAAADGRPDRPTLEALLQGLGRWVAADAAWGLRSVADLVAEAKGWTLMTWAERFPGVPPDLVGRMKPELLALPLQLVIGGLASDLGVAVPSTAPAAAPPAGGAS